MPALSVLLRPELVFDIEAADREGALGELSARVGEVADLDTDELLRAVLEREELCSTGFGNGVAMPHVRLTAARQFHVALGRVRQGVEFGAVDGLPVQLLLLIVGPERERDAYRKLLDRAARFLKGEAEGLIAATDLSAAAKTALTDY